MSDPRRAVPPAIDPAWRRTLWIALAVNAVMFVVEVLASWRAGSVALLADSIDFFSDAVNYALSLAVLGQANTLRSRAAVVKALCMGAFALGVLGNAAWNLYRGEPPEATTMGIVGLAALAANLGVVWMLRRFRDGDASMRSAWRGSRNDALGNLAVLLAALGVFGTDSAWPDLVVATAMALLALAGAASVLRQARGELHTPHGHDDHRHA